MPTRATSLKLPTDLKARVDAAAKATGSTSHAFMVDAIARETERAERYEQFIDDALAAEREMEKTGTYFAADDVFRYMKARSAGKPVRRPRAKVWRR